MLIRFRPFFLFVIVLLVSGLGQALAAELVPNGDFEDVKNGKDLRKDSKGLDWYESRHDTDAGRDLLKLSKKNIKGNKTKKAVIIGSPEWNTYLSYRLAEPQKLAVSASYDILVKEILPEHNRSGFMFLGRVKDKKGGPNSTGKERFVFLGFENSTEPGKINLFAREGSNKWADRTLVAENLDLNTWYTIKVEANIPEGYYAVTIDGVVDAFELESFYSKGRTPNKISHISFASWNDGPGTFYVDNISVKDQ
ncbi:MAG: hypothetical protein GY780_10290 [bacterium]|nr:hypothetical protein [bacterium]